MPDRFNISDVMISYSRQDKAFVEALDRSIKRLGRETWIDWDDIPPTVEWWEEIKAGIDAAHVFIFIISPASVQSKVCYQEIDYAVANNKRIVPILLQDIETDSDKAQMHPALASHNWVYFREDDDRDKAFRTLLDALDNDLEYVRQHTRLLVRANDWTDRDKPDSLLLRADDLDQAKMWLSSNSSKEPQPTEAQIDYIEASVRLARQARRGFLVILIVFIITGSVVTSIIFTLNRNIQVLSAEFRTITVQAQETSTEIAQQPPATQTAFEETRIVEASETASFEETRAAEESETVSFEETATVIAQETLTRSAQVTETYTVTVTRIQRATPTVAASCNYCDLTGSNTMLPPPHLPPPGTRRNVPPIRDR